RGMAVGFPGPYSSTHFLTTSKRPGRNREKTLGFVVAVVRFRGEKHYYRYESVFLPVGGGLEGDQGEVMN
ncbi:MAG: hypothetical protein OEV18_12335, partial [Deltaproteobacteria bacterium]|nr:hypothetical protein [Deltaproteobacteria bacterium]